MAIGENVVAMMIVQMIMKKKKLKFSLLFFWGQRLCGAALSRDNLPKGPGEQRSYAMADGHWERRKRATGRNVVPFSVHHRRRRRRRVKLPESSRDLPTTNRNFPIPWRSPHHRQSRTSFV